MYVYVSFYPKDNNVPSRFILYIFIYAFYSKCMYLFGVSVHRYQCVSARDCVSVHASHCKNHRTHMILEP